MLPKSHHQAQDVADRADAAFSAGDIQRAEQLYSEAAVLEEETLRAIPLEKRRTVGILGVSAASLWYRASRYSEAERVARQILREPDLPAAAREQIDEILAAIPIAGSLAAGGAILSLPPRRTSRSRLSAPPQVENTIADQPFDDQFRAAYLAHQSLLVGLAVSKFKIPEPDAEALAQEVFLAYAQLEHSVENEKAWLVAATCNAARHYWRTQARTESLPDDIHNRIDPLSHGLADRLAVMLTLRQALRYLDRRMQNVLFLHYFEGRSSAEIALELNTTPQDAQELIAQSLERVRGVYFAIANPSRSP